ncbi:YciI family protein [Ideonella sp.]|uniref:YciI family protein n=1 Tax=Ideonella sp. TaxID=1929293 RepID=UPI002B49FC6A|nr:YciI family protein [Ideonella sp.]HJV68184.1 YciI family protein [Ideonella sp.]
MPPPPTCLVVFHHPGPAWEPGRPMFEQAGLQGHIDHYRGLLQSGQLGAGGPFLDSDGGGMMIARPGMLLEDLVAFAENDPAVRSGLLRVAVRPWMPAMRASDGLA